MSSGEGKEERPYVCACVLKGGAGYEGGSNGCMAACVPGREHTGSCDRQDAVIGARCPGEGSGALELDGECVARLYDSKWVLQEYHRLAICAAEIWGVFN